MDYKHKEILQKFSTQKVELAAPDILRSAGQKAQAFFNDGRRDAQGHFLSASGEMDEARKRIEGLRGEIEKEYLRSKKLADDIGVDLDATTVGKNFRNAFKEIEDYVISCRELSSKYRKLK